MNSYGTLTVVTYSPALSGFLDEPLTLATVKEYLNLPDLSPPDTDKDAELNTMISAARQVVEGLNRSDIKQKQYLLVLDCWPAYEIRLRAPLQSVERVRFRDEDGNFTTLVEDTEYVVDLIKRPGIITLPTSESWPGDALWPTSPIEILFSSGYDDEDDIPEHLKQAMLFLVSEWFNGRLPFEFTTGEPIEIPYTVQHLGSLGAVE